MTIDSNREDVIEPLLYRWDDIVLSFSASSPLRAHSHGAAELVVALNNPFCTKLKDGEVSASSVLIPPTVVHQNTYSDPVSAVFYLDVDSVHYQQLVDQMSQAASVYTSVPGEVALQQLLVDVYESVPSAVSCYSTVVETLFGGKAKQNQALDPRIATIVKLIKANPSASQSVQALATQVQLSEDRLHHLFTSELGIPLHKYRMWLRLKCAAKLVFEGHSLTNAAHESGFADAAHFSRTFLRMYGAPPSQLLSVRRRSRVFFG